MRRSRPNPRRAKIHYSYSIDEIARLYRVHKNTVRAWLKAGLPALDSGRPVLVQGSELRGFLEHRRTHAKRPCSPGTLYCLKCREPRRPALAMVDFITITATGGNLRALCETCGTMMHRRARSDALAAIMPGIDVRIVEAPPRI